MYCKIATNRASYHKPKQISHVAKIPHISNNIFLVGPMGVGKTTIGKQLSSILNLTFKDSDLEIEEKTGASIPLIFEIEGEAGFRKREREAISELVTEKEIILSTGGGVVLDSDNRSDLKKHGIVIYLHASVEDLMERTAHSHNRPLLKVGNITQRRIRVETIYLERHDLYKDVADVMIETGRKTIRQVVRLALKSLEKFENT